MSFWALTAGLAGAAAVDLDLASVVIHFLANEVDVAAYVKHRVAVAAVFRQVLETRHELGEDREALFSLAVLDLDVPGALEGVADPLPELDHFGEHALLRRDAKEGPATVRHVEGHDVKAFVHEFEALQNVTALLGEVLAQLREVLHALLRRSSRNFASKSGRRSRSSVSSSLK